MTDLPDDLPQTMQITLTFMPKSSVRLMDKATTAATVQLETSTGVCSSWSGLHTTKLQLETCLYLLTGAAAFPQSISSAATLWCQYVVCQA